jgi:hypothetical protein
MLRYSWLIKNVGGVRAIAILFLIVSACFIVFPPWQHWYRGPAAVGPDYSASILYRVEDAGYAPLWKPPAQPYPDLRKPGYLYATWKGVSVEHWNASINVERLLLQLAAALAIGLALALVIPAFSAAKSPVRSQAPGMDNGASSTPPKIGKAGKLLDEADRKGFPK